jgi:hypothetical protein
MKCRAFQCVMGFQPITKLKGWGMALDPLIKFKGL